VNRHTANIASKPVATVNKTSQRGFPPLTGGVGDADELVSKAIPGLRLGASLCSLVDRVEMRLLFTLFFVLGALGVELIVVEAQVTRERVSGSPATGTTGTTGSTFLSTDGTG